MKNLFQMKKSVGFSLFILFVLLVSGTSSFAQAQTTIYMVRHANKASTGGDDPALTAEGEKRAQALKEALEYSGIDGIIVSDWQRTGLTAAPLAEHLGIEPVVIPVKSTAPTYQAYIEGVIKEIHQNWQGKKVLLVSHNGLMQPIAQVLGAPPIEKLEENDYNDFFIIRLTGKEGKETDFVRLTYGN